MASLNQVVSELAHIITEAMNPVTKQEIEYIVVHQYNEAVRHSYENHGYVDNILKQRFYVSLTEVNDGDLQLENNEFLVEGILRSVDKIPRPVRLTNNLPFSRVSTIGINAFPIPFTREDRFQFTKQVPGLCGLSGYDYINDYLYIFPNEQIRNLGKVCVEAAWEHPNEIAELNGEFNCDFDNEFLIPEDMVQSIKDAILRRSQLEIGRAHV